MLRRGHKASRLSSETTQSPRMPQSSASGFLHLVQNKCKETEGSSQKRLIYIYCYIIIIIIYVILIYFVIEIGWLRQRGLMIPDTVRTSLSTVQRTSDGMVRTLPDSLLEHALTLKPKPFKNLGFSLIKNRLCARLGLTAAGRRSAQMHPVTRLESRNPDV